MHAWSIDGLERNCWEATLKRFDDLEGRISFKLCIVQDNLIKEHFVISVSEHLICFVGIAELIARAQLQ